ncbi:unnamed protein product [Lepeophtheirus salmonis]|uniref:(salmon louse) hypothetical protein n=1 Tax=Lepeophtheirus salmonis TaxID=72036 RepID=A0A7R8D662_LEPSM|nr:unnamed protein product [Lepeophtheirus salmonis]CAF3037839.1 unnamed protein product [Lepeophtheirus salmonis]
MLSKYLSFILILGRFSGYRGCRPPKGSGDPALTEEDGWLQEFSNLMEEDEALPDSSNSMRQGSGLQGPSNLVEEEAGLPEPSGDFGVELRKHLKSFCAENRDKCSDNLFCKKICKSDQDTNQEPHASYRSYKPSYYDRNINNSPYDEKK